jgi:hypothetical protein
MGRGKTSHKPPGAVDVKKASTDASTPRRIKKKSLPTLAIVGLVIGVVATSVYPLSLVLPTLWSQVSLHCFCTLPCTMYHVRAMTFVFLRDILCCLCISHATLV